MYFALFPVTDRVREPQGAEVPAAMPAPVLIGVGRIGCGNSGAVPRTLQFPASSYYPHPPVRESRNGDSLLFCLQPIISLPLPERSVIKIDPSLRGNFSQKVYLFLIKNTIKNVGGYPDGVKGGRETAGDTCRPVNFPGWFLPFAASGFWSSPRGRRP